MYLREKYRRPENAYPRTARVTSGYRFYFPVLGRWCSRDPIGQRGGLDTYSLAMNEPTARVDVLGLLAPHRTSGGTMYYARGPSPWGGQRNGAPDFLFRIRYMRTRSEWLAQNRKAVMMVAEVLHSFRYITVENAKTCEWETDQYDYLETFRLTGLRSMIDSHFLLGGEKAKRKFCAIDMLGFITYGWAKQTQDGAMAFALQDDFGVVRNVSDSSGLFGAALKAVLDAQRQTPGLEFDEYPQGTWAYFYTYRNTRNKNCCLCFRSEEALWDNVPWIVGVEAPVE